MTLALGCSQKSASVDLGAPDLAFKSVIAPRPYQSQIPVSYDPSRAWPLLILLHGYGVNGILQDAYFGLSRIVDQAGFLYAYPDGLKDPTGSRYWNATDACCDLYGAHPDDVAYVNAIIDDMSSTYHVDPNRIFLAGHSNGGFLAHRLGCDSAPCIAAFMALAGDDWKDTSKCNPANPVSVLQVHGTADTLIAYDGGSTSMGAYPSARDSVGGWALKNGCDGSSTPSGTLDLDSLLPGNETAIDRFMNCRGGVDVELWTINGGAHIPDLQKTWAMTLWSWLAAHPKTH